MGTLSARIAHRTLAGLGAGGALLVLMAPARADGTEGPDGGAPSAAAEDGASIVFVPRPVVVDPIHACSFRWPICVHASARTDPARLTRVLSSVEQAWQASTWALRLPSPDTDPSTGAFDVYLGPPVPAGATAELGARDPIASFDRASAYLRVDPALTGCGLDVGVARALVRAIVWRTAPATDPVSATAEASYLARLMVPCGLGAPDGVDVFQQRPEEALTVFPDAVTPDAPPGALAEEYARGAALFYWWLDDAFGNLPGDVVRAIWALAPTRTPAGASRWVGRPDGFDVLRASFKDALTSGSTLDDLLLDFAIARLFVGDASDPEHMPETRALGPAGRPRVQWSIGWPASPRTLASGRGVSPTGAAYVEVSCREAPRGARLRFEARWEEHAKMRWAAIKVDAEGRERSAVAIPGADRGTDAQATIVDLDGVDRVVFAAANTGDPFAPFDPNERVLEPHGFVVSVAAETP